MDTGNSTPQYTAKNWGLSILSTPENGVGTNLRMPTEALRQGHLLGLYREYNGETHWGSIGVILVQIKKVGRIRLATLFSECVAICGPEIQVTDPDEKGSWGIMRRNSAWAVKVLSSCGDLQTNCGT